MEGKAAMENITKEEARRFAIEDAVRNAVEEVVGVNVLAETLVLNFRTAGDIIRAIPYGKVVEKKVIDEGVKELREKERGNLSLIYWVKIRAKVKKEKGEADPYFKIAEANLNREVFKEGDDMVIKVTPTRDCYINIFNILEDESVLILTPNRYKATNFIKAAETFTFPDEEDKKRGIGLEVHALGGKKTVETIYILCFKQPVRFDNQKFQEGVYGVYTGQTAFITDLIKEIIEIPLSERAEKFIQYSLVR